MCCFAELLRQLDPLRMLQITYASHGPIVTIG